MKRLGTETAFEVLAAARALEAKGQDIIHLEIGEPDFDTPSNIKGAAKQALDDGYTHYGPAAGYPALREAIAEEVSRTRHIPVDPDEVVVTPGAKPIMFFTLLACVDEGDEVIYPNPGFPIYESVIHFLGAKPVPVVLREEKQFRFDLDQLKKAISKKTRMLILNSPHNPTGGVLTSDDLQEIALLAVENDILVLSDEVYSRCLYDGLEHVSVASFPEMKSRTIILDGFSKTFAMTGWRLGFGVMPKQIAEAVERIQINSNSCTASFSQMAGIEALKGPQSQVRGMVKEFQRRRDVIVDGLSQLPGFRCHKPHGAFYVFPNVESTGKDSRTLSDYLLREAGVACLSGTSFGKFGEGYIRFSYATSVENIQKALDRIESALKNFSAKRAVST